MSHITVKGRKIIENVYEEKNLHTQQDLHYISSFLTHPQQATKHQY